MRRASQQISKDGTQLRLLTLLLALLLVACGPPLTSGNIIDKNFIAEHIENYTAQEYGCGWGWGTNYEGEYDYDFGCGRMIDVQKQRTVPDTWTITFEGCDNGEDCRQRTLTVTEKEYNSVDIGNYYYTGEQVE